MTVDQLMRLLKGLDPNCDVVVMAEGKATRIAAVGIHQEQKTRKVSQMNHWNTIEEEYYVDQAAIYTVQP